VETHWKNSLTLLSFLYFCGRSVVGTVILIFYLTSSCHGYNPDSAQLKITQIFAWLRRRSRCDINKTPLAVRHCAGAFSRDFFFGRKATQPARSASSRRRGLLCATAEKGSPSPDLLGTRVNKLGVEYIDSVVWVIFSYRIIPTVLVHSDCSGRLASERSSQYSFSLVRFGYFFWMTFLGAHIASWCLERDGKR